ncbi:zinc finger protein 200 isoform X7 [Dasypus novemcinctus]|uniref:zinc finger protein 200 isoform X7 n=1 Tax=Dasypus novemcinctus TaxID=9361 RepID=UPI00062A672E|nr:zinc finger protein 200 isoform X5 [Dasypus novemcinctus]XP_058142556.1 zinc finger protein 200 isoform X5 [Dasypus novemcinctus]
MAAKVVPMPPKPKRSFVLKVPSNSTLGQDLLRDATGGPKTIHQLVLEHFLTFLPKPSLVQPSQKVKETLVIMKDVSSINQIRVQPHPLVKLLPREGVQQGQETAALYLKAEPEELVIFEDLNVFHSQEECVSMDLAQQLTSENKEEGSVGEMMLLGLDSGPDIQWVTKSMAVIMGVKILRRIMQGMKTVEKSLQIMMKWIVPWSLHNLQIATEKKG